MEFEKCAIMSGYQDYLLVYCTSLLVWIRGNFNCLFMTASSQFVANLSWKNLELSYGYLFSTLLINESYLLYLSLNLATTRIFLPKTSFWTYQGVQSEVLEALLVGQGVELLLKSPKEDIHP